MNPGEPLPYEGGRSFIPVRKTLPIGGHEPAPNDGPILIDPNEGILARLP